RHASRAPAALAGEDLVGRIAGGAHDDRLYHAAGANGVGELGERCFVDPCPRLVLARPHRLERKLHQRLLAARRGCATEQRIESPAETARPGHATFSPTASSTRTPCRASSSRANARCAMAPFEVGSWRSTGL